MEENPKSKTEPKPCPFCGSDKVACNEQHGYLTTWGTSCQQCKALGPTGARRREEALKLWNKREIELCNVCGNAFCDWCCKYGGKTET